MQIGIIGLATSGKTTVFNALTHGHADTSIGGGKEKDPNRGIARVPDQRVDDLAAMYNPKKITYANVEFTDVAGIDRGSGKEKGFSSQFLGHLRDMEALILVIRVFSAGSVPHPEITIDPARDLDAIMTELIFADMGIIERRLQKIEESWNKMASKRKELEAEKESLLRFQKALENDQPINTVNPTQEEIDTYIRPYGLLSGKRMLVLANVGDYSDQEEKDRVQSLQEACERWNLICVIMNAQLEHDLLDFSEEEWNEYFQSSGLEGPASGEVIRQSYNTLQQHSFLTCGPDEVRAWTIPIGMNAQKAAGKIHSDIERGFIRAEVMSFQELMDVGSEEKMKKEGRFRLEGKDYIVQDGDIINFRFSV